MGFLWIPEKMGVYKSLWNHTYFRPRKASESVLGSCSPVAPVRHPWEPRPVAALANTSGSCCMLPVCIYIYSITNAFNAYNVYVYMDVYIYIWYDIYYNQYNCYATIQYIPSQYNFHGIPYWKCLEIMTAAPFSRTNCRAKTHPPKSAKL